MKRVLSSVEVPILGNDNDTLLISVEVCHKDDTISPYSNAVIERSDRTEVKLEAEILQGREGREGQGNFEIKAFSAKLLKCDLYKIYDAIKVILGS